MIYKGADSTIDIDIISDFNTWAYSQLINAGFENVTLGRALHQYCDMQLRLLPSKPRKVLLSKELTVPAEVKDGYELFKKACESGAPLLPFMSTRMFDASFKDKMIFDWGLFHFHLSTKVYERDTRFMDRSSHLLIAYVDLDNDDQMYFLQIRPHISSVWTEQELVRILVDNWPETMESRKVTGAYSLSADITDDDYKKLRKINANTLVDLHDGRIYMGANLGLNSAGTSVRSVMQHDAYTNNARAVEEAMGESVDIIVKTINRKLSEPENHFKLKMITPNNNDYLFEVVDHGFLLRYKIREDSKGIIIVGDTAEQIEAVLQKGMN